MSTETAVWINEQLEWQESLRRNNKRSHNQWIPQTKPSVPVNILALVTIVFSGAPGQGCPGLVSSSQKLC